MSIPKKILLLLLTNSVIFGYFEKKKIKESTQTSTQNTATHQMKLNDKWGDGESYGQYAYDYTRDGIDLGGHPLLDGIHTFNDPSGDNSASDSPYYNKRFDSKDYSKSSKQKYDYTNNFYKDYNSLYNSMTLEEKRKAEVQYVETMFLISPYLAYHMAKIRNSEIEKWKREYERVLLIDGEEKVGRFSQKNASYLKEDSGKNNKKVLYGIKENNGTNFLPTVEGNIRKNAVSNEEFNSLKEKLDKNKKDYFHQYRKENRKTAVEKNIAKMGEQGWQRPLSDPKEMEAIKANHKAFKEKYPHAARDSREDELIFSYWMDMSPAYRANFLKDPKKNIDEAKRATEIINDIAKKNIDRSKKNTNITNSEAVDRGVDVTLEELIGAWKMEEYYTKNSVSSDIIMTAVALYLMYLDLNTPIYKDFQSIKHPLKDFQKAFQFKVDPVYNQKQYDEFLNRNEKRYYREVEAKDFIDYYSKNDVMTTPTVLKRIERHAWRIILNVGEFQAIKYFYDYIFSSSKKAYTKYKYNKSEKEAADKQVDPNTTNTQTGEGKGSEAVSSETKEINGVQAQGQTNTNTASNQTNTVNQQRGSTQVKKQGVYKNDSTNIEIDSEDGKGGAGDDTDGKRTSTKIVENGTEDAA